MKITKEFACASRTNHQGVQEAQSDILVPGTEENQDKYCNRL
jgi:hypothetical protein